MQPKETQEESARNVPAFGMWCLGHFVTWLVRFVPASLDAFRILKVWYWRVWIATGLAKFCGREGVQSFVAWMNE